MEVLHILFLLLACVLSNAEKMTKRRKPHIVFMIVDDLGWNDVSFHGSKQIPTPNIDAIAQDGIILNQYYTQPTCSPSRGALMTGKYPIRFGFQHEILKAPQPWGLPLKERILPQYLKDLDYDTHAVGKWHLGFSKTEYLPQNRGFDSFFGFWTGIEDYYDHFARAGNFTGLDLHENLQEAWQYNGTYGTELFTNKAKKVIQKHNPDRPLFLYFAQQTPHSGNFIDPLQCPENYTEPLVGIPDAGRHIFAGMVSSMDHSVGEIFAVLEESKMLDNTIFIFTTDNGGAVERTDGTFGSNYPLKGSKYNLWEGGVRGVAFIWSPLLRNRSRIYNELMHISDWLPTLISAAGGQEALSLLEKEEIDGFDQWPSLTDALPSPRTEILLNIDEVKEVEGIRRGNFKLLKSSYYDGIFDHWYDLEGKRIEANYTGFTEEQKTVYNKTYMRYVDNAKAARALWRKYGQEPHSIASCPFPACKEQLELSCGPRPSADTCKRGLCLFDIAKDPCEFYNLVEQLPEVVTDLQKGIEKYKPLIMPSGGTPPDPASNPQLHGNAWIPWESFSSNDGFCSNPTHFSCSNGFTVELSTPINSEKYLSIIYYICIYLLYVFM